MTTLTRAQARQVLGLPAAYSEADLDRAFRRAAWTCHPDRGGDPEQFNLLVRSRELLASSPLSARVLIDDRPGWEKLADDVIRRLARSVRSWF